MIDVNPQELKAVYSLRHRLPDADRWIQSLPGPRVQHHLRWLQSHHSSRLATALLTPASLALVIRPMAAVTPTNLGMVVFSWGAMQSRENSVHSMNGAEDTTLWRAGVRCLSAQSEY